MVRLRLKLKLLPTRSAPRGRDRERSVGDLHAERWEEDSESDGGGYGHRVSGAGGEFSASVITLYRRVKRTIGYER